MLSIYQRRMRPKTRKLVASKVTKTQNWFTQTRQIKPCCTQSPTLVHSPCLTLAWAPAGDLSLSTAPRNFRSDVEKPHITSRACKMWTHPAIAANPINARSGVHPVGHHRKVAQMAPAGDLNKIVKPLLHKIIFSIARVYAGSSGVVLRNFTLVAVSLDVQVFKIAFPELAL